MLGRLGQTIGGGDFINGEDIAGFERDLQKPQAEITASASHRTRCLTTGLEAGAEEIVPVATSIATFEAVLQARGAPCRS